MMKKIILILISMLTFVSLVEVVLSAPMPWGIALNHDTKECTGYWGGDEFTSYALPTGWEAYYPNYTRYKETKKLIIETEIGECDFSRGNEEGCCNQLDYTFVSQNIGKRTTTSWGMMEFLGSISCLIFWPLIVLLAIIFIALKIKTKSFIPFLKDCPKKGLFIGVIIGLLSSLSFYSILHFSGCGPTYPIANLFSILSFPVTGIIYSFFDELSLSSWVFLLILNLLYFGLIGWIIGLVIQKLKKK